MLKIKHINALNRFALAYGHTWKKRLLTYWAEENELPARTTPRDAKLLMELRSFLSEDTVKSFKPLEEGYRDVAILKKDRQERFNIHRAWFVNAWRLVNHNGKDLIQPWMRSKSEAREVAAEQRIYLIEPAA